ncbi:formylglycine-generating enzyme family protein [Candidatus Thiothrix sp. Deng01]|uniref:Formylglycine-generating enzyme family protein n=1 Tax=Candidatus Thiothrix phosphatis TaxID=3112415 RepID=A0ABU6CZW1_9GAMM|nr:formylglycine-generating enzyme family protein [Candidatus Thiothrix sp. Deng01]MEB4592379.1 formylglycine-generating enzyme family protein [Candidatus Thiothrix sp. Deng01]
MSMATAELPSPEPQLMFVDELNSLQIMQLQRIVAEAHGLPPVFHDALKSGISGPELAIIPAGRFEMGSEPTETGHRREEAPRHPTLIQRPFAISMYPITGEEFKHFRKDTEWFLRPELIWHEGRYPVINVRMEDVKLYLAWLCLQTGQTYRLPTEAEWEYAARAGTTTPFHQGEDVSCKDIHFNPLFPYKEQQEKRRWYLPRCFPTPKASEVGMHAPNAWGLHDMHGNVWEFTSDHWTSSHLNANRDGSPSIGADPYWYVTKGGSWFDPAERARSAARKKRYLDEMDTNLGFRVVREL